MSWVNDGHIKCLLQHHVHNAAFTVLRNLTVVLFNATPLARSPSANSRIWLKTWVKIHEFPDVSDIVLYSPEIHHKAFHCVNRNIVYLECKCMVFLLVHRLLYLIPLCLSTLLINVRGSFTETTQKSLLHALPSSRRAMSFVTFPAAAITGEFLSPIVSSFDSHLVFTLACSNKLLGAFITPQLFFYHPTIGLELCMPLHSYWHLSPRPRHPLRGLHPIWRFLNPTVHNSFSLHRTQSIPSPPKLCSRPITCWRSHSTKELEMPILVTENITSHR